MVAPIEPYDARITAELRAYDEVGEVHDLPPIHHYWSTRYVLPLLAEVGAAGIDDLWESHVVEQCMRRAPEPARLVSLGAGNGEVELPMAARLAERGITNLELALLELNPVMIERALESAERLGLRDRVHAEQTDLNRWVASAPADIYIASHSLHHVVELENLYDQVAGSLDPGGVVLVNDMIGRNGHVRWPEAGEIVRRLWKLAPEAYRYNHFSERVDDEYPDIDCSGEGFEGIRAQDVLPLLLERLHPDVYVAFGNVIDPFVDRTYGPNFDPSDPEHAAFIDAVARLDEAGIELGLLTPTHLIASFRPRPVPCRHPRGRSPERTVRAADAVMSGWGRESGASPGTVAYDQMRAAWGRYDELRGRKAVRMALALADLRHRPRRLVQQRRSPR